MENLYDKYGKIMQAILKRVGTINGRPAYIPLEDEDEKALKDMPLVVADIKGKKALRTELENKCIHLYCTNVGNAMNDAGFDMKRTLFELRGCEQEIPWTMPSVKERLYRPTQIAYSGKVSSTELGRCEPYQVIEVLNRALAQSIGITSPYPSQYSQMYEALYPKR